jgi:hypothetical protein
LIVALLPTAGADYGSVSTTLTFSMADSMVQEMCVNVSVVDDSIFEGDESFSVLLRIVHAAVSIHINQSMVTIVDNDHVTLSLEASGATVPENAGVWEACVLLSGSSERNIGYNITVNPLEGRSVCG